MRNLRNRRFIQTSGSFYLYLSVLLLTLPLRWFFSLLICAVLHEAFHLVSAKIMGIPVAGIVITPTGAKIHTQSMTVSQELICALAGPIGGLLPVLFLRLFPQIALIALMLTLYNLLPLYPADGARVLRCGLRMLFSEQLALRICDWTERVVRCSILLLGLYSCVVLKHGAFAAGLAIVLAMRGKMEKHLAKGRERRYNIPNTDREVTL